ncbi:serine O-acetyltransferase [Crocinitomix catalasitica]|uniref:serine O-acetyltransferase n=1 Tax=Crocinitomix catalasitica TaxID=184607 RepID=UPI0006887121|nr:serine acetyltransferase [Crocinitomix catalasitica]
MTLKLFLKEIISKTIFNPDYDNLSTESIIIIEDVFKSDFKKYYTSPLDYNKVKYFPGLLVTFFYRIARQLFIEGCEKEALEYSSIGSYLTGIELYYSAEIGHSFKINHGFGTIVGSRTKVGNNVLLHQGVTIGEKNGGRATIKDNVIVYPGAVIVGPIVISENSIIGANTFVDKSCKPNSKIYNSK